MCVSKAQLVGGGGGGGGGVVGKYPTPEPCKIGRCPMSGTHKAAKCPSVEPGGMGIARIDGA